MKLSMKTLIVRLPPETHRRLKIAAAQKGVTISALVRDLINELEVGT